MTSPTRHSFPDLFAARNEADSSLGYGTMDNPTPIVVSSSLVKSQDETHHSLTQMIAASENIRSISAALQKGVQPLLTTEGTIALEGNQLLADIQLLQLNFSAFIESLGVINSLDVAVKNKEDLKLLIKLKDGKLWKRDGIVIHESVEDSEARDELKMMADDFQITVRI